MKQLSRKSTVFNGTLYEYTVMAALRKLSRGFALTRTGGANDRGIDVRGTWTVPAAARPQKSTAATRRSADASPPPAELRTLRLVVSCKAEKAKPAVRHFRELAGTLPAEDRHTLAILAAQQPATVQGQRQLLAWDRPMAFLCVDSYADLGRVRQFYWNQAAQEFLQGVRVVEVVSASGPSLRLVAA
ncbi:uncharacterized protein V1510DRAFT_417738 [Dipodascopsis tothii]|uniref:uncharacterized protein n=1 Tax=Dipodascopsis tothii TaxID=44089 RepID=UPI0034CE1798